jgi:hypothetical protein
MVFDLWRPEHAVVLASRTGRAATLLGLHAEADFGSLVHAPWPTSVR